MCSLLSIIFPQFCVDCGFVGDYLCRDCFEKIYTVKNNICIYCKKRGALGLTHTQCKKKFGIDGFISFYKYDSLFKKVMIQAKYRRAHLLLSSILRYANQPHYSTLWKWRGLFSPLVVPVPLHHQRQLERGFNQSEIIASYIAYKMGLDYKKILIRTKNTKHLANIQSHQKRKLIIKDSFEYYGNEIPKVALLVDDVVTTGATIKECAKTL